MWQKLRQSLSNELVKRLSAFLLFIKARRRLVTMAAIAAIASLATWYLNAQAGADASRNEIGLRLIIVNSPEDAEQVMSRLRSGEDFGALAWEKSTDPTAKDRGFMGRVAPAVMRPELRDAVRGLAPGQISGIVKTGSGYAVLKVLSDEEVSEIESQVRIPREDIGEESLLARKKAQLETVSQFKVFHDFRYSDKLKESGITFVHHVVDDAARNHKPTHYDHGNGIAVADVDGDGLYDIYFLNQVGGNELWKNLGGGKFRNITQDAGVGLPNRISVSGSFADIDNDGDQDLFVTTVLGGNVLFENDGKGHFKDITKEAGLDLVAHSSGSVFFDYDNDGLVDLLVCNVGDYTTDQIGTHGEHVGRLDAFTGHLHPERYEFPVLYKNLGHRRFKDVTAQVGLKPQGWCGDASFADLNGDGWPGLFILNMQGADHFYTNMAGRKFVDDTARYFPKTPWGAMGLKFFDFDNDGRMDLFITDMHSDMFEPFGPFAEKEKQKSVPGPEYLLGQADRFIFGNALYHNLGGGKFEEVSDRMGVENYWPWGPSVGDINADGWEDIFIASSMNFPFRYGINSMLLNNRGEKFLDSEFILGIEPRRDARTYTPWYKLDCDQLAL